MIRTVGLMALMWVVGCDDPDPVTDPDRDGDRFPASLDCNDDDDATYPGADELCDGLDNDCDEAIDEDAVDGRTYYQDADGDGYGTTRFTIQACDGAPDGYVQDDQDCDDLSGLASPDGDEVCDGLDNDCDGLVDTDATDLLLWYLDGDGDGYGAPTNPQLSCTPPTDQHVANGLDCDDTNRDVNPAQSWFIDADQDGFGNALYRFEACGEQVGFSANGDDCDDLNPATSPDAVELCDDIDNDCDGDVDINAADAPLWYPDGDEDGYGDEENAMASCTEPTDTIAEGGDCDDSDADVNPNALEFCDDSVDNDCDGHVDLSCEVESTSLPTLDGQRPRGDFGYAVTAGDFNGDDDVDVAVSAPLQDIVEDTDNRGRLFVYFGPVSGDTTEADVTITGSAFNYFGRRISLGGDVDDDGLDDLLVSADEFDAEEDGAGRVYLFYGVSTQATWSASDADVTITGLSVQEGVGEYLAQIVPDLNGDTHADLLIGTPNNDDGASTSGRVAWFYGPFDGETDLTIDDGDVVFQGSSANTRLGEDFDRGDFNGDGAIDYVMGGSGKSEAYVFDGPLGATAIGTEDADVVFSGPTATRAGSQVNAADLNDDGHVDLWIGLPYDDTEATSAGRFAIVPGPFTSDAISIDDDATFNVYAEAGSSFLGLQNYQTQIAKINDDDIYDVFVGNPRVDYRVNSDGAGVLMYGPLSGSGTLDEEGDFTVVGTNLSDQVGHDIELADLDGDDALDMIIGARGRSTNTGAVYLLFNDAL
ncbi:MAG: MopE-related protein [Myxococcota bacterium]